MTSTWMMGLVITLSMMMTMMMTPTLARDQVGQPVSFHSVYLAFNVGNDTSLCVFLIFVDNPNPIFCLSVCPGKAYQYYSNNSLNR